MLTIEETKVQLNQLLQESVNLKEVEGERIEDAFFEVSDEDADIRSERGFVRMSAMIFKEQEESSVLSRLPA